MRTDVTFALLWTIAVVAALLMPSTGTSVGLFTGADKVVHVGMFAGLGVVWMYATRRPLLGSTPASFTTRVVAVAAGGTALAVGTEVAQHAFVPGRTGDVFDAAADLAGLAVALTAYAVTASRRSQEEG